jgi:hypothetical protein
VSIAKRVPSSELASRREILAKKRDFLAKTTSHPKIAKAYVV